MKKRELLQPLAQHGCAFAREGAGHSFFVHPANKKKAAVPRHREISDVLARRICKELGIPQP